MNIPHIPFYPLGEDSPQMDLYTHFSRQRIIFLRQELTDEIANQIVATLLHLEAEDSGKEIRLYLNSPGGSITAGLAIYDTMQCLQSDVMTICLGQALGISSLLLAAGTPGKRCAVTHARISLYQPSQEVAFSSARDLEIAAKEVAHLRQQLNELYAAKTGQSLEKIASDTERNGFLSAQAAQEYGLIDQVTADQRF